MQRFAARLGEGDVYVVDAFAGADPAHRIGVRVVTENPWHALFAKTLFIDPTDDELAEMETDALVLHAPSVIAVPEEDGTRSGTFVCLHPSRTEVVIGGTYYAGEIKKSIFTVMNDRLPLEGVLPMHCSANVDDYGRVAVFFGLSGTGKTTLSADPERHLIGDDEHGWADDGIFNFEGGCYAKVIRLSAEAEPEIYATTRAFGTVLENVVMDERGILDLDDDSKTENTRSAYKLEQIANALPAKRAGHPSSVVFLTADAFGILPPIARLTREQALYWFLSGSTAKLAGTEIGVKEPQPTFSPCFGAPLPSATSVGVRTYARGEARAVWSGRLARQHGVDRRALRRGQPDADPGDARPSGRRPFRGSRRRRIQDRFLLRLRRPGGRTRCTGQPAQSAPHLGRSDCLRREGARVGAEVPQELGAVRRRRTRRGRLRPARVRPRERRSAGERVRRGSLLLHPPAPGSADIALRRQPLGANRPRLAQVAFAFTRRQLATGRREAELGERDEVAESTA